jgi:arginyl-tRNA--protein-N-Asp/Glu arginylyltransferase
MGKDFYEQKFGDGTFSANKIKELINDTDKSHFNMLLQYTLDDEAVGYAICYENTGLMHYCYPFYHLKTALKDAGMGMMLRAILYAQEKNKQHVYLGSAQRSNDTYKLQFGGTEWFDGKNWQNDVEKLKILLQK